MVHRVWVPHGQRPLRRSEVVRVEAVARASDVPLSVKNVTEVGRAIKGMEVESALAYLERVLEHKDWIPLRRYNKKVPHRKGSKGVKSGRFLDKTVAFMIKLIRQAVNNARNKGMEGKLYIKRVWVGKGYRRYVRQPKGMYRIRRRKSAHVEVVVSDRA